MQCVMPMTLYYLNPIHNICHAVYTLAAYTIINFFIECMALLIVILVHEHGIHKSVVIIFRVTPNYSSNHTCN